MTRLIALSTVALSALASVIAMSPVSAGEIGEPEFGADPAMGCETMELEVVSDKCIHPIDLSNGADAATLAAMSERVILAAQMADFAATYDSALVMTAAAAMLSDVSLAEIEEASRHRVDNVEGLSADTMLDRARALAGDDQIVLGLIDDLALTSDRGSDFDIAGYDGFGGESWVDAGDAQVFRRAYGVDTEAQVTLVGQGSHAISVTVFDANGDVVCVGEANTGANVCSFVAYADQDYAIHVVNNADTPSAFTIWTN